MALAPSVEFEKNTNLLSELNNFPDYGHEITKRLMLRKQEGENVPECSFEFNIKVAVSWEDLEAWISAFCKLHNLMHEFIRNDHCYARIGKRGITLALLNIRMTEHEEDAAGNIGLLKLRFTALPI